MAPRVLVAGLCHETHTFLGETTLLEQFQIRRGAEVLDALGDGSPLGTALERGRELGWQWVPALDARATPSATVADEVVELFWQHLQRTTEQHPRLDGALLVLHGAMVSESYEDVEGEVLRRLRQLPGWKQRPVVGVLDLHANHSQEMARWTTALVAYRCNPHTDAAQTGHRAVELLQRIFSTGQQPQYLWQPTSILWPPTGTATAEEPMRSLVQQAQRIAQSHAPGTEVNVLGGYSFADTYWTGVSFSAVAFADAEKLHRELRHLAQMAWKMRHQGNRVPPSLEEMLPQILAQPGRPVVIVEPSDNIGGGAPGNSTAVVRALLEQGVDDLAAVINDPLAVQHGWNYQPGERFTIHLGPGKEQNPNGEDHHKSSPASQATSRGHALSAPELCSPPLVMEVELVRKTNGRFRLEDSHSHLAALNGLEVDMGRCLVVRRGNVWLLITSRKTPPFDLGQLRSQGIEPRERRFVVVKAAVAHRRAYDPIAAASFTVDTPGPCSSRLERFPFQRLRRPVFPLDPLQHDPLVPEELS